MWPAGRWRVGAEPSSDLGTWGRFGKAAGKERKGPSRAPRPCTAVGGLLELPPRLRAVREGPPGSGFFLWVRPSYSWNLPHPPTQGPYLLTFLPSPSWLILYLSTRSGCHLIAERTQGHYLSSRRISHSSAQWED